MNNKKQNQRFYRKSYSYLISILPEVIEPSDLERYFIGDDNKKRNLKEVYDRFLKSAQNYQAMPNIIGYEKRKKEILPFLHNLDYVAVSKMDPNRLYQRFVNKYMIKNADSPRNSWLKWCKAAVDAAKFLTDFKNIKDFDAFVGLFDYNVQTRTALPLLLSSKINGMGFALSCDLLKELGYTSYSKPDIHIKDICKELKLTEETSDEAVFEFIDRVARDNDVTPYKVDKILWLICSGNYYKDKIKIEGKKKQFITYMKKGLKR